MAYITSSDLSNRYARLKVWTDDNLDGTADAAVVAEIIALAEGTVNRYVGQQYAIPLALGNAETAKMVRDTCGAICGYRAASRVFDTAVPQNIKDEYDAAIKWLEAVAAGKVYLQGETAVEAAKPGIGIVLSGSEAVVTRESMDGL